MKYFFLAFFALVLFVENALSLATDFIPEASGATKMGESLVIAGDEEPQALWLLNSGKLSKLKAKNTSWDDMESLATMNENQFFAMTSHSLTKKGKRRPEREQLFLMSLGKEIEVKSSWSIRDQILQYLKKNLGHVLDMDRVTLATPDEGGLNVEGLAYNSGKIYLGLRSPVTLNGEAIILVMETANSRASISEHVLLSLQGNGIRGLDSKGQELYILGGAAHDFHESFSIAKFHLTTRVRSELIVPGFEALIRPESLVVHSSSSLFFTQDFEQAENQDPLIFLERPDNSAVDPLNFYFDVP